MTSRGTFYGIGVGPGAQGLLTLSGAQALQSCRLILCPRAKSANESVAKNCIANLNLPEDCFEIIEYGMEEDRSQAAEIYIKLAQRILLAIEQGDNVAYLTIGDALTYSTYGYTVMALQELAPQVKIVTIPGITSFAALAARHNWPLGQGKERMLILPCPDSADTLREDIERNDIVILMKIGKRLPMVLELVESLGIAEHCVLGSRLGLPGEYVETLSNLEAEENSENKRGYLSTMLIRKTAPGRQWLEQERLSRTTKESQDKIEVKA